MNLIKISVSILFLLFSNNLFSKEDVINLQLKDGIVKIKTFEDKAPKHVKQITDLVAKGSYDGVVFHRVIDGFMAQTGDVKFGNSTNSDYNLSLAGTGGSDLPDLKAEFSEIPHVKGILSAARSSDPNSFNSQFFICLDNAPHLDRQYSVFGKVTKGMEFIDKIKKGAPGSGAVDEPDKIISLKSK